jgi:hypothetical protein
MSELTCRACYAATLTPAERERFYAEPVTSCIYWCDDHQRAMDEVVNSLPQVQMIKASASAFEFPMFAGDPYDECTCGHLYDDHVGEACGFYGCGCGVVD